MTKGLIRAPIQCGRVDCEVQDFIEVEYWNIGPFPSAYTRSAQELYNAALFEFGEKRVNGFLEIQQH